MTEFDGGLDDERVKAFQREMLQATVVAEGFGRAMTRAFDSAIVRGRDFGDVLRSLALQLSSKVIGAALKPIGQGFGSLIEQAITQPFASAGSIATPSYFPIGGLTGERRGGAEFPQVEARPPNVTVHISTPDAASFRRSEAYLSGTIARAVARGERNL
jgi:hypothetical protein